MTGLLRPLQHSTFLDPKVDQEARLSFYVAHLVQIPLLVGVKKSLAAVGSGLAAVAALGCLLPGWWARTGPGSP